MGEAADLKVRMVQFIGGEPTIHPAFAQLVRAARGHGLEVEIYTNLTHVPQRLWRLFSQEGVSLATSFYSMHPAEHDKVTTRRGSQGRTLANIQRAVAKGIPIRVGMTDVTETQDVAGAAEALRALGISEVRVDRARAVGRGTEVSVPREPAERVGELCGQCGQRRLAIGPDGDVWPCVFSRWLTTGNILDRPLADVVGSPETTTTQSSLAAAFAARVGADQLAEACDPPYQICPPDKCDPDVCHPDICGPSICQPDWCDPLLGPCDPLKPHELRADRRSVVSAR